jgi:hypothetical protein
MGTRQPSPANADERLEVVGPSVAVIDVIGVLPDIAAENGLAALHEGVLAVVPKFFFMVRT